MWIVKWRRGEGLLAKREDHPVKGDLLEKVL